MNIKLCTICGETIKDKDFISSDTDDGTSFYAHEKCVGSFCDPTLTYNPVIFSND